MTPPQAVSGHASTRRMLSWALEVGLPQVSQAPRGRPRRLRHRAQAASPISVVALGRCGALCAVSLRRHRPESLDGEDGGTGVIVVRTVPLS